jgi:hypothetical protein
MLTTTKILWTLFKESDQRFIMETNEDVISRLKFIGKIQKGEKINVRNMSVQPDSIITRIYRSFINLDSRINTLNFVTHIVKKSFELINMHLVTKRPFDKIWCVNIINDLNNSRIGLLNLKDTYAVDIMFCCKIDTLIQEMDARIQDVYSKFETEGIEFKKKEDGLF